ncbi:hypothetical protein ACQB60_19630 [Actinomycetota bacterium Odt1-20B]
MTTRMLKKEVLHVPESGWAKARRLRGKRIRTCVAPVETAPGSASPSAPQGAEGNIVRGED